MSDTLSAEIGKIIRRERQARGMTIEALAHESGRCKVSVARAETGQRSVKVIMLFDLLWALDCGQDVFLEILSLDASLRSTALAVKEAA
mgnify:CR=1 FL=1|nr:helix-turn-helix transcriptional regulator [uncultured Acetobacter sp.]